jgi:Peptidase A4 family
MKRQTFSLIRLLPSNVLSARAGAQEISLRRERNCRESWRERSRSIKIRILDSIVLNVLLVLSIPLIASAQAVTFHDPVRFTVSPGSESAVFTVTLPLAECTLYAEGTDPAQGLKLFSDQDGNVHFHVRPPADASESQMQMHLRCEAKGTVSEHPVVLRASKTSTSDMPFPTIPELHTGAKMRPPLSGDPLAPSQEELMKAGYPYRPDLKKAPEAYVSWLKAVSKPTTLVAPNFVARPDLIHGACSGGTATTLFRCVSNWSGVELERSLDLSNYQFIPYTWVTGTWTIPSVSGGDWVNGEEIMTASSMWIGLDGDSYCAECQPTANLIQDGTEQDGVAYLNSSVPEMWWFPVYFPWTEVLPAQPTEQPVNFAVYPGDEMFSEVWVQNACDGCDPYLQAYFVLEDLTRSESVLIPSALITNPYRGQTAEWIMERPGLDNDTFLYDLSDYSTASMWGAYALLSNGEYVDSGGGTGNISALNSQITSLGCAGQTGVGRGSPSCATNQNDVLSTVVQDPPRFCELGVPCESSSMTFTWHGFH